MGRYVQQTPRRKHAAKNKRPHRTNLAAGRPFKAMSGVEQHCSYRKQSHRGQKLNTWDPVRMQNAVEEWRKQEGNASVKKCPIRTIARAWDVPYETLRRRIYGKVQTYTSASGRPTVLKQVEEAELVNTLKDLAEVGFPLIRKEVQELAFTYAKAHGYKGFSDKKGAAGYYWFHGFLNRHPDVSIKKAENLSVARAMSMNKVQVFNWFEAYEALLKRLGVRDLPRQIWNLDETGVQNIHKADEVVGIVGAPTYNVTALEKGETSTVVAIMNAFGDIPPPMVIHKGKNVGKGWKDGAPYGTLVKTSDSGWINKDLFLQFGEHFVAFLKNEGLDNGLPHVLLMDNHYAHIFNLEFLHLMKQNNIHVFALPPHTTHWLQPLDRVPFGSLKRSWNEEMRLYTRSVAGAKLEKKYFFKIFSPVWQKSLTVDLAQAGFRATGLFPVNRRVIPDDAFAPSAVTDRDRSLTAQKSSETSSQEIAVADLLPISSGSEPVVSVTVVPESAVVLSLDEYSSIVLTSATAADQLLAPTGTSSDADQSSPSDVPVVIGESGDSVDKLHSVVQEPSSSLFPSSVAIADQLLAPTGISSDAEHSSPSDLPVVIGESGNNVDKPHSVVQEPSSSLFLSSGAIADQQLAPTGTLSDADQPSTLVPDQPLSTVTFASLMRVPHRERSQRKTRKKAPSYEITSEECMSFVSERVTKKSARKKPPSGSGRCTTRKVERETAVSPSTANSSGQSGKANKCSTQKKSVKGRKNKTEDVIPCGACGIRCCDDKYNRDWIRCQVCLTWYHNECQGLPEKSRLHTFICVSCED